MKSDEHISQKILMKIVKEMEKQHEVIINDKDFIVIIFNCKKKTQKQTANNKFRKKLLPLIMLSRHLFKCH